MKQDNLIANVLLTALAPLIWGSTYLVTTEFLPPDRPFTAAVLRCLPAGVLLLLWTRTLPKAGDWGKTAALAFLNIGFFQAMLFIAAYRLPGGLAAVLSSTQVLMVLLLLRFIGRETVAKAVWLFALLGVVGVAMLVLSPHAKSDTLGIVAALAGAASMASGVFFGKRWQVDLPLPALTGWQLFLGGLMLLPVAAWRETLPAAFTAANIGGYLYLCLFGAVLSYALYFRGIAKLPPAAVSSLGLLSPVCAFILGWLFLQQHMNAVSLIGFVLVLVSVFGVQRAAHRK
ncbi:Uncharacterized inner membrane transporter yedA [Kingella potus]|uniref:Uncharacterized inner membrane transporter yedA n=1 Tax=Kingella potus TaxID=265175 RepID=A0A377R2U6_9NEIS|nr:EamA family transporter [Kingella potus]UOO99973.1 EamA family transporter [Kingella potus]STR03258.1 Uncharacterized inner membrane transporter yedA [Kingella potus]